jgi:hypothetical protein
LVPEEPEDIPTSFPLLLTPTEAKRSTEKREKRFYITRAFGSVFVFKPIAARD